MPISIRVGPIVSTSRYLGLLPLLTWDCIRSPKVGGYLNKVKFNDLSLLYYWPNMTGEFEEHCKAWMKCT